METDLPGLVLRFGADGALIDAGAESREVLELDRAELLARPELRARGISPNDRARIEAELEAAVREKRRSVVLRYAWHPGADATRLARPVEERVRLKYDDQGALAGRTSIVLDARDAPEGDGDASRRARIELLDMVAHELRSPLFPIIALSDLLLGSRDGEVRARDQREYLGMIRTAGKDLLQLVTDLLEIARLDAGRVRPDPGPVDLRDLVGSVAGAHGELARDQGIEIDVDAPPRSDGPVAYSDRGALRKIGASLAAFGLECSRTRRLRASVLTAEDAVGITLRLEGDEMSDAEVARVFEPFWERTDGHRTKIKGRRSGLSLVFARRLTEVFGGRTASRVERGSTVVEATLPAAWSPRSRPSISARAVVVPHEIKASFPAMVALCAAGAEVSIAGSAHEAAERLRSGGVQILVVDPRLPDTAPIEGALRDAEPSSRPQVLAVDAPGPPPAWISGVLPRAPDAVARLVAGR